MIEQNKYDISVIGGGHNGLVAAAYLAKAGKSVCVLERRHVLGGCAITENLWPKYQVSTAAYVISLFLPDIIRQLRLKEYGLTILPRIPSSFTPLLDGRYLLLGRDESRNRQEIAKFSTNDADAFQKYNKFLDRVAELIEPLLTQSSPDPLPLPKDYRKPGFRKRYRDLRKIWTMNQVLKKLGSDMPEAIELLTGAAKPILDRWFESEPLKATLATDAIIGAFASISHAGTAYVLLHHVMGEAGGARGLWGYVKGGMGGLADALESACKDLKVDIFREAEVKQIVVNDGSVEGVLLVDGRIIESQAVASSADAHITFERLINPKILPEDFRKAVARIDYASASAKINLALSEPPRFKCIPHAGVGPHHHGTIHISPTLNYIERAYDDAKYGKPSTEPVLEIAIPSSVDPTLSPEGKHVMSIFVQYAPYTLSEDNWDDIKEKFADRCIETLTQYAPNVLDAVEYRQVLSPVDLERTFGITGGNIMQGAMSLHQLYMMRPVAGWADHRTPIKGLYLCGAASHPGGGVMGACGKNAAVEILRDF
jgi:phytoene dehydrogenase-like protein